jgi:hypothetical protein
MLGALLALAAWSCGPSAPSEVQLAAGDGPQGRWTAAVHRMDNGLIPDKRVCVRVRVQGGATLESSCGFDDPGSNSAEMDGNGLVFAQTWAETATQARFEPVGGPAVVVPLGRGDPISQARWMVLWMDNAGGDLPHFSITFLDAAGREVDTLSG